MSIVESLLDGLGGVGALTFKKPSFLCHCSDERVYTALRLLERTEVCARVRAFWVPVAWIVVVARALALVEMP